MGNTVIDQDFPFDILHRGSKDESRHNKRVNDAVKKQLRDVISQQDIISGEGNKKVKVRLKYLDQYRFIHSRDHIKELGRDEFDDLEEEEILFRPDEGDGVPQKAGEDGGEELYEAEYTIDELTEILMSELKLPRLDERKKNEIISEIIEWNDIRKESGVRSLINKKRTLRANIKRKAKMNTADDAPIINDDFRFRTYDVVKEKHSNAVIFLMMDRSGSMWQDKIYAVKALYFWIVQFLRFRYDKVEIKFIAHDYNARELSEKEFFTISDSGGTRVSSAYELCRDIIKHNYPSSKWNIYCFHASDGDSWNDEDECARLVEEITTTLQANLFAYAEINIDSWRSEQSDLWAAFQTLVESNSKVLMSEIQDMGDVLPAIETFLKHSTRTQHAGA